MTLGERIKKIRIDNKITQKDFAERLFVSSTYISKVEHDSEVPTDMFLKLLSYEFNVSFEFIKTGHIPDFNISNSKTCMNYFYEMNNSFHKILKTAAVEELEPILKTFGCFTSLLWASGLKDEEKGIYYNELYSLFDEIEQLQFKVSRSSQKSFDLLSFLDEYQDGNNKIKLHIKKILNVYLLQNNIDFSLR